MYDPSAELGMEFAARADKFTKATWLVVKLLVGLLFILTPIAWIMQLLGSILMMVSFGLYAWLYTILLWWPILGLLLGTSWLWFRLWPLRPILLVPGIFLAVIGDLILMFAPPDRDREATLFRAALAEEWPFSWQLMAAMKP